MAHSHSRRSGAPRPLGLERLEPRAMLAASDLRITEFLASNEDGLRDVQGDASDWIEIHNPGATQVSLAGMYLTDNASNKTKWAFPAGTVIPAGGYRIVFASDKNGTLAGGELHTNFKLSADGEYLGLIDANGVTVIDQYTPGFPLQGEDVSYGHAMQATGASSTIIANGATARGYIPTSSVYDATWRTLEFNDSAFPIVGPTGFGYENSPGDPVNFTAEIATSIASSTRSLYMRIPFTLSMLTGIDALSLRMRYDDGFVAYINGEQVYERNAPDVPQWNSQAAGSNPDSLAEQFETFDISTIIPKLRVGANVLAIHALNVPGSDMLIAPELIARAATTVAPTRLGYFDAPTPGYGNGTNYLGFALQPTYSVPHGFYSSPQTVALSAPLPGSIVVYTTNGSTPTVNSSMVPTNGTLYTGPLAISSTTTLRAAAFKVDYKPSHIAASTYIFLNDVVNQSTNGVPPTGWPADGAVNGQRMNYGIDPEIVSLYGAQAVKDSLASLPSFSITTDLANLFDPATGIYVNATNDGRTWERPASVELINPDGSSGFTTNAGLRIRGGYSRNDFNPKHAFRLYFRGEYGDGKLNFPLFGAEGTDEFDVLDLRTESNYSWSSRGDVQNTFLREVFSRDLQGDLGDAYTRSRYYHLYVDGQYFGVYQTQERVQEFYGETYFGGNEADYDVLKAGLADVGGTQLAAGNEAAWTQLFTLAQNLANNPAGNANNYFAMQGLNPDGTRNPAMPVLLDVDNLVNYMLIIIYTGGFDTGISRFLSDNQANNWYGLYNRVAADQGFQFFLHDNEHSLGADESSVHASQFIDRTGPFNNGNQAVYAQFNPQYLHQDLLAHPEYRQRFIEKAQEYLTGAGPMTSAASIARMEERRVQIEPAIIAEAARWGDSISAVPRTKATWQAEVNWLYNTYFSSRTATVINQLRADQLYVTPPTFSLAGGEVPQGSTLTIAAIGGGAGSVYYTTDGVTDPRLMGGGVNGSPAVKLYSGPIAINQGQTIQARFRTSAGAWSVLVHQTYETYLQGDYDLNGQVDGNDFVLWQRSLGASGLPAGSGPDGNRDGQVTGADLVAWQTGFGSVTTPQAPAVAAALEPPPGAFFGMTWDEKQSPRAAKRGERVAAVDEAFSHDSAAPKRRDAWPAREREAYQPWRRREFAGTGEGGNEEAGPAGALETALGFLL